MSVERFSELVAKQPTNDLFRFSLSKALCDAGRWADAVPHLERCASSKADWMLARILLGKALLALGRKDEALPVLREALRLAREQDHEDPAAELEALLAGF